MFDGSILSVIVYVITMAVIIVGLLQSSIYVAQIILANMHLRQNPIRKKTWAMWKTSNDVSIPISIIVPAYNEEQTIIQSVHSFLALEYPEFEAIVVNDGSKDSTLRTLISGLELSKVERAHELPLEHQPIKGFYAQELSDNIIVVDKENGGKADAINAGINISRNPIFCVVDADSLLEGDSLLRAIRPFIYYPEETVAVGGVVRVANGCTVHSGNVTNISLPKKLIELFQALEYLRAFLIGRLALEQIDALTIVSGAFGLFRREIVIEVGGYDHDSHGEDLEVVASIHRKMCDEDRHYSIQFVAESVCWTMVPDNLQSLAHQRIRWQKGAVYTLVNNWRTIFNPRYRNFGVYGMGQMFISDFLVPISEFLGYTLLPFFVYFDLLSIEYFIAFLILSMSFGLFFSVASLMIEDTELKRISKGKNIFILIIVAIVENLGYRQLMSLFRIIGIFSFFKRSKRGWTPPQRKEFIKHNKPSPTIFNDQSK